MAGHRTSKQRVNVARIPSTDLSAVLTAQAVQRTVSMSSSRRPCDK